MVVVHQVLLRIEINTELTLCTDDLGNVLLAVRHHTRRIVVRNAAVPEFNDADRVIVVVVLLQAWLGGHDAVGGDRLGYYRWAEIPQCKVNVMDGHYSRISRYLV